MLAEMCERFLNSLEDARLEQKTKKFYRKAQPYNLQFRVLIMHRLVYGFQAKLHGGRMASDAPSGRHPIRESAILGWHILRNWFLPGRKSMVPYSIQWLMRLKPAWFRHDLLTLFDLLQKKNIKPLIAERLPLGEAQHAHELLGNGGVIGKIVLIPNA